MQSKFLSTHVTESGFARVARALSAVLIGFMLVLLVGFAPIAEVHNAAHDTRHAAAFPCH